MGVCTTRAGASNSSAGRRAPCDNAPRPCSILQLGGRDDQERAAREGTERPGQGSTHRRARPPRSARLVLPGRHGRHREDRQGRPGAEDCCQSRQEEVAPLASRPPAMSLYLQPDVELTAEDGSLLLSRRGVPVAHVLGVGEAVALSWLGHTGSFDAALEACMESLPGGATWLHRVVDRYWTYLGDGPPRPLELEWLQRVVRVRPKVPLILGSNVKQDAAPACVTWMVTLGCNRHCPYCFFDVFHFPAGVAASPPDATFTIEDPSRTAREM